MSKDADSLALTENEPLLGTVSLGKNESQSSSKLRWTPKRIIESTDSYDKYIATSKVESLTVEEQPEEKPYQDLGVLTILISILILPSAGLIFPPITVGFLVACGLTIGLALLFEVKPGYITITIRTTSDNTHTFTTQNDTIWKIREDIFAE